jgi:peptide/nickel transport system permease protein
MTAYIIRRLIQALIVVFIVTILLFITLRLMPGDPVLIYIGEDQMAHMTEEELEAVRHELGLDKPIILQYFSWLEGVFRGDLGKSAYTQTPVVDEIARSLPITLYLGGMALVFSTFTGVVLGVISAIRRAKWLDTVVTVIANIGITVPSFWLGILLIYFVALNFRWLPTMGYTSPFVDFSLSIRKAIMPVICLSVFILGATARQTRSSMLETIRQDYIRTAWAMGLRERSVIIKHTLKNGLLPVFILTSIVIPHLFGGSVLIETVFNIPGMGRLMTTAIFGKDYAIVEGVVLITVIVTVAVNLLVDILQGWFDPRIRLG